MDATAVATVALDIRDADTFELYAMALTEAGFRVSAAAGLDTADVVVKHVGPGDQVPTDVKNPTRRTILLTSWPYDAARYGHFDAVKMIPLLPDGLVSSVRQVLHL